VGGQGGASTGELPVRLWYAAGARGTPGGSGGPAVCRRGPTCWWEASSSHGGIFPGPWPRSHPASPPLPLLLLLLPLPLPLPPLLYAHGSGSSSGSGSSTGGGGPAGCSRSCSLPSLLLPRSGAVLRGEGWGEEGAGWGGGGSALSLYWVFQHWCPLAVLQLKRALRPLLASPWWGTLPLLPLPLLCPCICIWLKGGAWEGNTRLLPQGMPQGPQPRPGVRRECGPRRAGPSPAPAPALALGLSAPLASACCCFSCPCHCPCSCCCCCCSSSLLSSGCPLSTVSTAAQLRSATQEKHFLTLPPGNLHEQSSSPLSC